jgi:hypothetical protein
MNHKWIYTGISTNLMSDQDGFSRRSVFIFRYFLKVFLIEKNIKMMSLVFSDGF